MTIMISVALTLSRKIRTDAVSSRLIGDRVALYHMADAVIHAGMTILVVDKMESKSDSIQEKWADSDFIKSVLEVLNFENSELGLTISDELGRIQVNALVTYPEGRHFNPSQHRLWIRFLQALSVGVEEYADLEPATIINPIKDWLDHGDDDAITGLNGAESGYYQELEPSYSCRNGPFKHLYELLLVKGVTRKLFYGVNKALGFTHFLTVYGMTAAKKQKKEARITFEGKININTAELPVIAALLPAEYRELAPAIIEYREAANEGQFIHDLSSPTWYRQVAGLRDVNIDAALLTTSSDFFRLEAKATRDKLATHLTAIVQRIKDKETGRWRCRVVSEWQDFPQPENTRDGE
jgi:general secretion pathway protein K